MAEDNLNILVMGFVAILVGIVFASVIADSEVANTQLSTNNESITITAGVGSLTFGDVHSISYFGNDSNNTNSAEINIGAEVNLTTVAGSISVARNLTDSVNNSIFGNGNYDVVYTYEGAQYVADSASRVLISLIPLFFVLAVLFIGVALASRLTDRFNFKK